MREAALLPASGSVGHSLRAGEGSRPTTPCPSIPTTIRPPDFGVVGEIYREDAEI